MRIRLLALCLLLSVGARGADLAAIDAYCRKAVADWNTPGLAIAIVQDDRVVLTRGFGVREFNKPEPVTENTLFAIASNSKAFTAAGVAILVNQKKLKWDDRVQVTLPWFQVFDDAWVSHETRIED